MPRFTKKSKEVDAIQLSPNNLQMVPDWSRGEIMAKETKNIPKIIIGRKTDKPGHYTDIRYAEYGWWLIMDDDGKFDVMYPNNLEREYQVI